nr:ATP-binding protein [Yersinia frederiksenii]
MSGPHSPKNTGGCRDIFDDFLEQLLQLETNSRNERRRQTLLRLSGLPAVKTLEQFDFKFSSGAPRAQLQELAGLAFR